MRKFCPTRPEGAEALSLTGRQVCDHKKPRAMPWAKSFWAFSPYLNHLRNLSKEVKGVKEFQMWKWISLSHLRVSKQGQALRTPGRSQ